MGLEERVTELESRLAFQDDTIQALSDVLVAQQQVIDRVQLQLATLARRQEELQGRFDIIDDDVPPPHY
ncbi:hypothetical protein D3880_07170 [Pseudomonas cavernae]|uniref:Protein SlyX homolog n=1 Tax=Pseudomonas cavernae TaxID=2320867 RepID=A0A385Z0A6_9PSED|nr:SlyX family protein [Pseudomonas cavernae]AYC32174.1 hypothetical protein D3880_07170 [Pseudomonas cavernae]